MNKQRRSCAEKVALAAGSLAGLALAPGAAEASLITVNGSPVSLSIGAGAGASATWDVDGTGGTDFRLRNDNTFGPTSMFFASDYQNGRGLVGYGSGDNVQRLAASFNVGPTNYWGPGSYRYRHAMYPGGGIGYDFAQFSPGDNLFGFRFLSGGNLLYGFATINFDTANGIVSISDWTYETTPDTALHVGTSAAVPEPSSLSLLAMGAGGLAAYRRRRKRDGQARAEEA